MTVSLSGIAAPVTSGGFVVLVLVLAVPILRLRHTVDAATATEPAAYLAAGTATQPITPPSPGQPPR